MPHTAVRKAPETETKIMNCSYMNCGKKVMIAGRTKKDAVSTFQGTRARRPPDDCRIVRIFIAFANITSMSSIVYSTILVGGIIAAEATLSFLGIGLQLPAISWGLQINSGQRLLRTAPHIILFPSLFLSVTVLSFILLGDALRDALDPKLR